MFPTIVNQRKSWCSEIAPALQPINRSWGVKKYLLSPDNLNPLQCTLPAVLISLNPLKK